MPPTGIHTLLATECYGETIRGWEVCASMPDFAWFFVPHLNYGKTHDSHRLDRIRATISKEGELFWVPELIAHHFACDAIADGKDGILYEHETWFYKQLLDRKLFRFYPRRIIRDLAGVLMDFALDFVLFERSRESIERLNASRKTLDAESIGRLLYTGFPDTRDESLWIQFVRDLQKYDFHRVTTVEGLIGTYRDYVAPVERRKKPSHFSLKSFFLQLLEKPKRMTGLHEIVEDGQTHFRPHLDEIINTIQTRIDSDYIRSSGFMLK